MQNKKVPMILLVAGIALAVFSTLVPLVAMELRGPGAGIIGGSGWPTFWLLFRQYSLWMLVVGSVLAAVGAVLLIKRRKQ